MTEAKRKVDFTEGGVFLKLVVFILPIIATNLLQALYNAADMMVVSFSHEENAVGAIGTTGSFINLIINIFIGFSVGANVVVARYIGAKDKEKTEKAVHTALVMAGVFGLLGMTVGLLAAKPVMGFIGNTGSLLTLAVRYTYLYFLGVPFLSLTNFLIAIFRAKGDAKTPLVVLMLSGLLNVALNFFFVLVMGLSVEGVAIATAVSNAFSAAVLLIRLRHSDDDARFSFKKLCIDKQAFRDITVNGVPAGIQGALFSVSNMLIQSSIVQVNNTICAGSEYAPIVDGNSATTNLEGFVYTAMNAVYQGAITFTSQNLGAGKPERVYKIMYNCLSIVTVIGVAFSGGVYLLRDLLLSLYGVAESEEGSLQQLAYETAVIRLRYICLPYVLCGLMEVCSGTLRGLGKSFTSMVISLVGSCIMRLVWIWTVFAAVPTLQVIYVSYPISWALTCATSFAVIQLVLHKIIKTANELRASRLLSE